MSDALEIRLLRPDELETFRTIRLRAILEEPTAFLDDHDDWKDKPLEAYKRFLSSPVACAFAGREPVGMAVLGTYIGTKLKHKGIIGAVYVAPEMRGRGLAKKLILLLEEQAKNMGIEQLSLATNIRNDATIGLYEKLGFIACGVEMHILKLPDGSYIDDVQMVKFLK